MATLQSGVLPYRISDGKVLLITSRRTKRWIIPKGMLEPDMTPAQSAEQEAMEEAGVLGIASDESLGEFTYRKYESVYRVRVFAMRVDDVLDDWPEKGEREREWFSREEAMEVVEDAGLRAVIGGWEPARIAPDKP